MKPHLKLIVTFYDKDINIQNTLADFYKIENIAEKVIKIICDDIIENVQF